jgi:N-acyl-D-aspartate/D-glutamate deacylase
MLLKIRCVMVLLVVFAIQAQAAAPPFDIVLRGGMLVDGSGAPAKVADLGITAGRIVAIGDLGRAPTRRRIEATGLVVAPGFIDVHNHSDEDVVYPAYRAAPGMIRQGVTTAVFGVDGSLDLEMFRTLKARLAASGVGVNFAAYIGHNGLREKELGMANRVPTGVELARMKGAVRAAMNEGALGLSTGLMYLPGLYATTDEVVELAKETAPYGGLYDSHDRDPAFHLLDSVAECLTVARRAGIEAHIAHIKAVGLHNAGRSEDLIRMIDAARARGERVTADAYPYDGATTRLVAEILIPPAQSEMASDLHALEDPELGEASHSNTVLALAAAWRKALANPDTRNEVKALTEQPHEGVFSWVMAVGYDSFRITRSADPALNGRMIVDIATERGQSPFSVLVDLLIEQGAFIKLTVGSMREDEVRTFLRTPWTMISSDGREGGLAGGQGHPRYRGSFARVLAYYVRDRQVLSLEEAVHKMSGLTAAYLKLSDRGVLRVGAAADIAVFDPKAVQDRSTWENPAPYADGMRYVFVNGVLALDSGEATGALAGRFLPFRNRGAGTTPKPTP